jgi:GNAT superfamily N-acetyltransferase
MPEPISDSSPGILGRAVEENAVALWRSWSGREGTIYSEDRDRSFVVGGVAHPAFNHLFRLRLEGAVVGPFIERSLDPFRERGVPCFCWIDPAAALPVRAELERAGLAYSFTASGMAVPQEKIASEGSPPAGPVIEEVLDREGLKQWCTVISEGSSFAGDAAAAWLGLHSAIPFGPGTDRRHFLARLDGEPVGTSSLFFEAGVAGIYSVVVLQAHRRCGVGTALSLAALEQARASGFSFSVLVSTVMGIGLYRRLGFREYRRWEGWLWSPG